ncbi:MAG: 6,7-dimethyl-8-ribityllumazine synthase [Chloroflexota bacterium]|nr:6,7-dimethyl-8-ribityllumazine synthase [Dehalococcoidia bacterium]MDW8252791.1 6,7-dimethyl-8-ribityllumazine synthase [Chloroflexota bacterium]
MGAVFSGGPDGAGLRIAIAVARYNELVTKALLAGAREGLERHGVNPDDIDIAWVPGSFELPLAADRLARTERYDAVICLGAVIRGETAHFDYVAGGAATGIGRVALDSGRPIIFGVLTVDTLDQALARAGGHVGNKGYEAALAAIEMVNVLRAIDAEAAR